jgi:hypothetical protein
MTKVHLFSIAACLAIVQEVNTKIKEVDPNKKIEVGGFRVDPKGKQKLKKVSGLSWGVSKIK